MSFSSFWLFFRERIRALLWFYKACHTEKILFSYQHSVNDHWNVPYDYFTEQRVSTLKKGIDTRSCKYLDAYIRNLQLLLLLRGHDFALVLEDREDAKELRMDFRQNELKKYKDSNLPCFLPESLYFHHGLRSESSAVKEYVQNKIFIDGGACHGDSTLAFQQYKPKKVVAFDISERNAQKYRDVMRKNHIPEEKAVLILKGLGERHEEFSFSDDAFGSTTLMKTGNNKATIIPLDSCTEIDGTVGLIKLDLEGFGYRAVKGMIETIKSNRPVLAIAVYHNEEELFGIKPLLESLNLNYKFEFKPCGFNDINEMTLFAYPMELSER